MNFKKLNKKNKGFTLIEILIVIGIIAILAAIVIIAINPAKQFRQARDTQRTANVNAILNAVGQYLADHKGSFPPPLNTATLPYTAQVSGADIGTAFCNAIMPEYIPAIPADPSLSTGAVTSCTAGYDTGYKLKVDTTGRVTVSADKENPPPTVVDGISVTR